MLLFFPRHHPAERARQRHPLSHSCLCTGRDMPALRANETQSRTPLGLTQCIPTLDRQRQQPESGNTIATNQRNRRDRIRHSPPQDPTKRSRAAPSPSVHAPLPPGHTMLLRASRIISLHIAAIRSHVCAFMCTPLSQAQERNKVCIRRRFRPFGQTRCLEENLVQWKLRGGSRISRWTNFEARHSLEMS